MDIERLRIFQALRLKGRVPMTDIAGATGLDESKAAGVVADLKAEGLIEETRERLKLSAEGQAHRESQLAEERHTIDEQRIFTLYQEFDEPNGALKALMTRWQLKSDDVPNDHADLEYDQGVIDDLVRLDADFQPLLDRIVEVVPRLGHYPSRFNTALVRVQDGDHSWFAKPLADSYHTVWFELHEELIGLGGLSRADEAAAGRAE